MIKPVDQPSRLAAAVGIPGGAGDLRERLLRSFQACGVSESWIPEDMLEVLEKRLQEREDGDPSSAATLDELDILKILADSLKATGFADVAAAFLGEGNPPPPGERRSWTAAEIASLLDEHNFPPAAPAEERKSLARRCLDALGRLDFATGATASLVLELARHLLPDGTDAATAPDAPPDDVPLPQLQQPTRYIGAGQWAPAGSPQLTELLRLRILRPCPASDILPVAVVECNLTRLYDLPTPPLEEDLAPLLRQLCQELKNLLAQMHGQMAACWPDRHALGSRVIFNHYDLFLRTASRSRRRRDLDQLRERLAGLWTTELAAPDLALSFLR